jgi:vacuolar-type H+-ATPase subunit E/Vma4
MVKSITQSDLDEILALAEFPEEVKSMLQEEFDKYGSSSTLVITIEKLLELKLTEKTKRHTMKKIDQLLKKKREEADGSLQRIIQLLNMNEVSEKPGTYAD